VSFMYTKGLWRQEDSFGPPKDVLCNLLPSTLPVRVDRKFVLNLLVSIAWRVMLGHRGWGGVLEDSLVALIF